jgi:hypothetical protein
MDPRIPFPADDSRFLPRTINPQAFVACPVAIWQGLPLEQRLGQSLLYQVAFEQAASALRPSLVERGYAMIWN